MGLSFPISWPISRSIRERKPYGSFGGQSWSPLDIPSCRFLLDVSDTATLFQNDNGTSLVTAIGQSVGSWRDLSINQTLFAEASTKPVYGRVPATGLRNCLHYTRAFDNAFWTKTASSSVSANATTGPDGSSTADRITLSNTTNSAITKGAWAIVANRTFTLSCYFKNDTCASGETFQMRFFTSAVAPNDFLLVAEIDPFNKTATYSLTGTATTGRVGIASGSVTDVGNGWFRVQVTGTCGSGVGWSGTGTVDLFRTAGSRVFFATDIQLEEGGSATNPQVVVNGNDVTESGVPEVKTVWFNATRLSATINLSAFNTLTSMAAVYRPVVPSNQTVINQNAANTSSWQLRYGSTSAVAAFTASGTTSKEGSQASLALGAKSILTGRVNIAAPFVSIQQNDGAVATISTTLGSGNFSNSPVRIGQRTDGITSITGHFVALALFTEVLSAENLALVKAWMNERFE
jgi:hypothetical protein